MKGAIYFAKNSFTISKRIARFSLGIKTYEEWNEKFEKIPGAIKIKDEQNDKWVLLNKFTPFYKKNKSIDVNSEGKKNIFDMRSEHSSIEFYKSDFDGPIYVVGQLDENKKEITEKFGCLKFNVKNFDIKETGVEIEVKLGRTFLSAKVVYLKTKETFYSTFSFNK